jgi:hypothetical protein
LPGTRGEVIHVVFDGPPAGSESGRFIEVETPEGKGLSRGEWVQRQDGYWALVLTLEKEIE